MSRQIESQILHSEKLMELLSKATSTHELPEAMLTKGGGLSDEKAILLIMRHLEDFYVPSSDNK